MAQGGLRGRKERILCDEWLAQSLPEGIVRGAWSCGRFPLWELVIRHNANSRKRDMITTSALQNNRGEREDMQC